jgi:hypothetical protein
MDQMKRFAVYFAPRKGPFATQAAAWLGWDVEAGQTVAQPDVPGIAAITEDPRKYGFHGTLRAPFRLGQGVDIGAVQVCVAGLAARLAPARCAGLDLVNLEGFLALVPRGDASEINDLAADVVVMTNGLRADLTEAEVARRRPETLTVRQRELLTVYGYPHVLDEFQFHLTLTSRLPQDEARDVAALLGPYLAPVLPEPFVIEDLCLFGEDAAGRFHLLNRYALTG